MAGKINLLSLKAESTTSLIITLARYEALRTTTKNYMLVRWVAQMSAVEMHSIWERYCEARLVAALNHSPAHFIEVEAIKGIKQIPTGLADFVVRSGRSFFDFRSAGDLIKKGNDLLGVEENPFKALTAPMKRYLDCLAAIRNEIVHASTYSRERYRSALVQVYGMKSVPNPDEFLNANDARPTSPAKWQPRIRGLAVVIQKAIDET